MKIDIEQFPSDKVIEVLSNAENLKLLSDKKNFINDLDFTQDFSRLFIREEDNTWLLNNRYFRMQGFCDIATHTILDNDFKISRNCLTFIKHTNKGDIR